MPTFNSAQIHNGKTSILVIIKYVNNDTILSYGNFSSQLSVTQIRWHNDNKKMKLQNANPLAS